jgi:hypothetical protein
MTFRVALVTQCQGANDFQQARDIGRQISQNQGVRWWIGEQATLFRDERRRQGADFIGIGIFQRDQLVTNSSLVADRGAARQSR